MEIVLEHVNLFLFSVAGLIISSLLCAFAWNIGSLIVLRTVQGVFCGIIQPVTLTVIYQMIPEHKRSTALGYWSAVSVLGPALAPTISGWLQSWNWPMIFLLMIPFRSDCMGTWVVEFGEKDRLPEVCI